MLKVPVPLLLDPRLPATAKLLWMLLRLHGPGIRPGQAPLAPHTVRAGLAHLTKTGWSAPAPRAITESKTVTLPADLLTTRHVRTPSKILYGLLHLTPGFAVDRGTFTYQGLRQLSGASLNAIKQAVRDLTQTGWLLTQQEHQRKPITFTLGNPEAARAEREVARARGHITAAPYQGEALMREYLSLLVDSTRYEDDAAPGYLINPLSDQLMEFDRFNPPGVAFEFQGPQHYGPTDRVTAEDSARQQARDLMKIGQSVRAGVSLVLVHPGDLSLEGMRRKIGDLLPPRDLTGHERLIAYLERVSRRYRAAASQ